MDSDLIDWVCTDPRVLMHLLMSPELGWSFQYLCNLIDFSHNAVFRFRHLARKHSETERCKWAAVCDAFALDVYLKGEFIWRSQT